MIWFNRTLFIRRGDKFFVIVKLGNIIGQNYKSAFGLLFALLFLISNLVPFLPQKRIRFNVIRRESYQRELPEKHQTWDIEICDNIVDDDGDGLIDNQDVVDCPVTAGPILTPTPEAEEEATSEEELTPTPEAEEENQLQRKNQLQHLKQMRKQLQRKKQMKSLKLRSATTL